MNWNDVIEKVKNSALEEIEKFGSPPHELFSISLDKAIIIANNKNANINIVTLGSILADYKLGQALSKNRLVEHVKMSANAARDLLVSLGVSSEDLEKIISCIEQHHWSSGWSNLESEIVANADCYRFLTPNGVIAFIKELSYRNMETKEIINYVLQKAEEKWNILSLAECKKELEQNYIALKSLFTIEI